jgi:hypothetical protein
LNERSAADAKPSATSRRRCAESELATPVDYAEPHAHEARLVLISTPCFASYSRGVAGDLCALVRVAGLRRIGHHAVVRGTRSAVGLVIAALVVSACGGSSKSLVGSAATTSSTAHATGASGSLQAAAVAWAHAYLTGTALDQLALQGPECLDGGPPKITPANLRAAATELQRERAQLQQYAGVSPATIQSKIVGVSVRNLAAKTGEAEVRCDLPVTVTGNDNWVTYELMDGKWKVQDCRAPFGGSGDSSSSNADNATAP